MSCKVFLCMGVRYSSIIFWKSYSFSIELPCHLCQSQINDICGVYFWTSVPLIFFLIFFLSFLFLATSGLSYGMQDLRWGMCDLSLWHSDFSLVVACGFFSLSSCGTWAPGRVGSVVCGTRALLLRRVSSVVVACRLSCPAACGILVT